MQLVNCIEAIKYFNIQDNDLLILAANDRIEKIDNLISEYSQFFSFSNIYRLKSSSNGILTTLKEFELIRKTGFRENYDAVFISNYKQARQRLLIKNIETINPRVSIILIDDGLAVCEIVARRNKECYSGKSDVHYPTRTSKLLYSLSLGNYIPKSVIYFTVYNNLELYSNDSCVINGYDFIKNINVGIAPNINNDGSVVILGQPLVGRYGMKNLTKEKYSYYLTYALTELGKEKKNVYYFPHPVENINETLTKELQMCFHVQVPKVPFEIIALKLNSNIPIISFYTSALVNLQESERDYKVVSVYFNEVNESDNSRFRKVVNEAYDYMKSLNIEVLNK